MWNIIYSIFSYTRSGEYRVYDVGLWSTRYRLLVLSFADAGLIALLFIVGHLVDPLTDRRDRFVEEDLFLL